VITATVPGATLTSTGLDIVNADTSNSICQTVTVVDYGVVECLTKLITIDAGTTLAVV
jgi:voltage-gated potassium channel Kch